MGGYYNSTKKQPVTGFSHSITIEKSRLESANKSAFLVLLSVMRLLSNVLFMLTLTMEIIPPFTFS